MFCDKMRPPQSKRISVSAAGAEKNSREQRPSVIREKGACRNIFDCWAFCGAEYEKEVRSASAA